MPVPAVLESWSTQVRYFLVACYRRRDLRNLFVLALVLRLSLLWESARQIGFERIARCCPDAVKYLSMAQSVLAETQDAEKYFFLFGPGYAYFLSFWIAVLGSHPLPLLFINVLMSTVSCLLVYKLANDLTGSYPVAIVSGLIVATSYTSITLSTTLLSDTLFNTLFTIGLIVYIRAHRSWRWPGFIFAGTIFGAAVLVRAPAQLWPIMMIVITLALLKYDQRAGIWRRTTQLRRLFVKPAIAVLICALIVTGWVLRNYSVHDVPVVSMSSSMCLARTAIITEESLGEQSYSGWMDSIMAMRMRSSVSPAECHRLFIEDAVRTFKAHPWDMINAYLDVTWENITAISRYHRFLLPDFKSHLVPLEYKITDYKLNYLCFWLSVAGFLILLFQRKWTVAMVLGSIYFYWVPLVGFNAYQGSRVFFPAQIAWAILIAVVLVSAGRLVGRLFDRNRA